MKLKEEAMRIKPRYAANPSPSRVVSRGETTDQGLEGMAKWVGIVVWDGIPSGVRDFSSKKAAERWVEEQIGMSISRMEKAEYNGEETHYFGSGAYQDGYQREP